MLGKTTFHLVALDRRGEVLVRKKFTQKQLLIYTANLQTCLIGLSRQSATEPPSARAESLPPGLGLFPDNIPPEASPAC